MAKGSPNLEKLKATELEKTLKGTIYSKHRKVMDDYIMGNLQKEGSNFSIPIVQALIESGSTLEKKLLNLYHEKTAFCDTSDISDEMKLLQASAFDSLVVGVNVEKDGEIAIYTANVNTIFSTDVESKFTLEKTVELNRQGIVNAVRIDIEYTSEEGFTFKQVSLNKNTNLKVVDLDTGEGRFLLVPYIAFQRAMVFFKSMMDDKRILEVTQDKGGNKVRYITTRLDTLAKFSDSKGFVEGLKPSYFPLKGFFYAPVLGAPSTTIGKTRVDLISISEVRSVTNPKVEKANGSLSSMVMLATIQSELSSIKSSDDERYHSIVMKLPNIRKYITDVDSCIPGVNVVMSYIRSLDSKGYEEVVSVLNSNISGIIARSDALIGNITGYRKEDISKYSAYSLKELLKSRIVKFVIRKKNCEYSTIVGTNNTRLLEMMYGKDYFSKYESLGSKLYMLEDMIDGGSSIKDALIYCMGESNPDLEAQVISIMGINDPTSSTHERLANLFGENTGKKSIRSSASSDVILVRKCFAYLSDEGSVDFYRYLDMSKVEEMYILG